MAYSPQSTPEERPTSEAVLIQRVCGGDRDAFYDLVRPYERAVYVTAISIVDNQADAEEVAQEAVLKAFMNIGTFRGEAKFSTWLIQITINEARMKVRKDRRHLYESTDEQQQGEEGDYWPKDYADWRPIPNEALERKELRDALKKGIASLSPKYREVFVLRDVQNVSITETARILGISEANVKTRLLGRACRCATSWPPDSTALGLKARMAEDQALVSEVVLT